MAKQVYLKVIDYLTEDSYDHKKVCIELARCCPTLFVRLVDKVTGKLSVGAPVGSTEILLDTTAPWYAEYLSITKSGTLIEAIKKLREHTRLSLKEAKEHTERIRSGH